MAGMEELEIHSKSYLVRWIHVKAEHTISWSIQPHRKSLNFGIFKHPGPSAVLASTASSAASTTSTTTTTTVTTPGSAVQSAFDFPSADSTDNLSSSTALTGGPRSLPPSTATVIEKLTAIGLRQIQWIGKCEADKISQGTYDVSPGEGGNYALVFDNTFSKQTSKTVTFVLLTYPTSVPPQSGHNVRHSPAMAAVLPPPPPPPPLPLPPSSTGHVGQGRRGTVTLNSHGADSTESLKKSRKRGISLSGSLGTARSVPLPSAPTNSSAPMLAPPQSSGSSTAVEPTAHTGVLHKRRRKRHQGWARRFFSLDFASATLSYYHDRNSAAMRGAIPLGLAVVATNEKTREISIDSGAEIWHLRALNDADFEAWKHALEKASSKAAADESLQPDLLVHRLSSSHYLAVPSGVADDREWGRVEALVNKVSSTRDAMRQLAQETDSKHLFASSTSHLSTSTHPQDRSRRRSPSPHSRMPPNTNGGGSGGADEDSVESRERRPFWRRKSNANVVPSASAKRPANAAQLAVAGSQSESDLLNGSDRPSSSNGANFSGSQYAAEVHEQLLTMLRNLDATVMEFGLLLEESKQRRHASWVTTQSRHSMESDVSQEFFDAIDDAGTSPFLTIREDSDDEEVKKAKAEKAEKVEERSQTGVSQSEIESKKKDTEEEEEEEEEEEAESEVGDAPSDSDDNDASTIHDLSLSSSLFPTKPKSLVPLPLESVRRRANIKAPTVMPPSLIGFLRKNVGKDLSQISMPVSANEPLSLLQRAAEVLEYSNLLDKAAGTADSVERLMYVTAFALSSLSSNRVRERAIRKPFNPMLGETYELVREDRGFRFVAEKVSHRPVQLAYQAEHRDWSITQSPMPTQKFWGKSAEIVTDGKIRLTLHTTGEHFSWSTATSFLRNIIAGEKYVEPSGEMSVLNETTGHKTISSFKAGGMFSGRSEDVTTRAFDSSGEELPVGLLGTWTSAIHMAQRNSAAGAAATTTIWTAGRLVPQAPKHYGLPLFAATLNEITSVEEGRLPATDSRLRPDQRALEDGDLERAEALKAQLEESQRARRRQLEDAGAAWAPRWFSPAVQTATTLTAAADQQQQQHDSSGEVVWRLKTGKDGYWEERSRGAWSGVVPVFTV